jgi:hypothetical protein
LEKYGNTGKKARKTAAEQQRIPLPLLQGKKTILLELHLRI